MNQRVTYEVLMPLLGVRGTGVIFISTPANQYNMAMRIIFMVDDNGNSFFYLHICEMRCKACISQKRLDCTHMEHLRPAWKDKESNDMVRKLMHDEALMAQETMGVTVVQNSNQFDQEKINLLLELPEYPLSVFAQNRPNHIIMACDPNGGGSSHTSIVTIAYHNHYVLLLGVESHCTKEVISATRESKRDLLQAHVKAIRSVPQLSNTTIIFVPECNLGEEHHYMAEWMQAEPNVRVPAWGPGGKSGLHTTNSNKISAYNLMDDMLKRERLRFLEDMVCSNPFELKKVDVSKHSLRRKMKQEVVTQMSRMRYVMAEATDTRRPGSIIVSGKCNERGVMVHNQNDDITMAFFIALLADQIIIRNGL